MYVATDLHGHTRLSDARTTPGSYVRFRGQLGIKVVAIADHDILAGVRAGAQIAAELGMILVPAMEATSFVHRGTSEAEQIHILAYYPPHFLQGARLEQTRMYQRGLLVQRRWRDFILDWLCSLPAADREALSPNNPDTLDTADAPRMPKTPNLPTMIDQLSPADFPALQTMVDRVAKRTPGLFRSFIKHHLRFWLEDEELFGWSPEELIDVIRADGATDIVAHPARYRDKERLAQVLLGASGVEVYTSRHRPEWAARFRAFAEAHGKLWTASSDDHQHNAYARPPCGTPLRTVEHLLQQQVPADFLMEADTWAPALDLKTPPDMFQRRA